VLLPSQAQAPEHNFFVLEALGAAPD